MCFYLIIAASLLCYAAYSGQLEANTGRLSIPERNTISEEELHVYIMCVEDQYQ